MISDILPDHNLSSIRHRMLILFCEYYGKREDKF